MTDLINNHVLIPNGAEWSQRPSLKRAWQTGLASGNTGPESRFALRSVPRVTLAFNITPTSIIATQQLDDRLRAAIKSGLAVVPFHGRGAALAADADAGATEVQIYSNWNWQAGDYFFAGDESSYDAIPVAAAALAAGIWTLTLDDPLELDHVIGELAWPLLFGNLSLPEVTALTPRVGPVRIEITELVSGRSAQIGAVVPDVGTGIGHMAIGSTFVIA